MLLQLNTLEEIQAILSDRAGLISYSVSGLMAGGMSASGLMAGGLSAAGLLVA